MKSSSAKANLSILLALAVSSPALAQANHNTARSNKNTVAAPAGTETTGSADAAPANHNTARSNKNTVAAPDGAVTGTPEAEGDAGQAKTTINTSRSNGKGK